MPNRLAQETSPYLLQHQANPVDWFPWGEEALQLAKSQDRPILLSIGYSTCHWCHVMERESFEDTETAAYMNEHFVCIKVDREERPDIDALYMEAVQAITGQGGWPLTVFCDSEAVPFHGGTYFPPRPTGGMPSFMMVMEAVIDTYRDRRDEIRRRAPDTIGRLGAIGRLRVDADSELDPAHLDEAMQGLMRAADHINGGFGGAPKFPPASALEFLLTRGRADFVGFTLDRMLAGGIYDQVGGGFARYSVDAAWQVPHFEKMLYDNALLARVLLHTWQETGRERYRRACIETLDWAQREMTGPDGEFYAAIDADSEGEEGLFYVWPAEELREVLLEADFNDDEAAAVARHYGVTDAGNFEGRSVLHLAGGADDDRPALIDRARSILLKKRDERVRPGLDSKCLTAWNALMISAMAEAGVVLGERRFLAAATAAAEVVLTKLRNSEGRLLRSLTAGEARLNAYLEDHAFLLEALITLHEATFEERWFSAAETLAGQMLERFGDAEGGGFFTTAEDHEALIVRRKDLGDHPIPSGNSSAALGLLRLSALTGEQRYREAALATIKLYSRTAAQHPDSFGHLLQAMTQAIEGGRELAIIAPESGDPSPQGPDLGPLVAESWRRLRPGLVRSGGAAGSTQPPLLRDRTATNGRPAAYLCRNFSCRLPVSDPEELALQLEQ